MRIGPLPELAPGQREVPIETMAGTLDAAFLVRRWERGRPTIIYHHGNQERPFDFRWSSKNTFRTVLAGHENRISANLVAIRAPFHALSIRDYMKTVGTMDNFAAMIAASTVLLDRLVAAAKAGGSPMVLATGISLGGWVVNLHHACFDTADAYVPLLAGAALGEVFVTSDYRRLAADGGAFHDQSIRAALNFESDFALRPDDNVFPLLATHDRFIVLARQRVCYRQRPVKLLDKGHVTAALAADELRSHILSVLHR